MLFLRFINYSDHTIILVKMDQFMQFELKLNMIKMLF